MSNFKIGQKVVCVSGPIRAWDDLELRLCKDAKINEIYTVREIIGSEAVLLQEIVNPPIRYRNGIAEMCFSVKRFRPLDHAFADEVIKMICEQPETVEA